MSLVMPFSYCRVGATVQGCLYGVFSNDAGAEVLLSRLSVEEMAMVAANGLLKLSKSEKLSKLRDNL